MADEEKQGSSLLRIIGLGFVFVVLAVVTSFVMYNVMSGQQADETLNGSGGEIGPTYEAGEFLVNLDDPQGRRFARTSIVFEVNSKGLMEEIEQRKPQIRDEIIGIMRQKSVTELRENDGVLKLRQEIIENINAILQTGNITNVYFTEFVVQ